MNDSYGPFASDPDDEVRTLIAVREEDELTPRAALTIVTVPYTLRRRSRWRNGIMRLLRWLRLWRGSGSSGQAPSWPR